MEPDSIEDGKLASKVRDLTPSSRRSFLQRSAAAGAGVLAVAAGSSNTALAQEADDDDDEKVTDIDVLNFALTLEHLEYAFYRDALERFCWRDFQDSECLDGFCDRVYSDIEPNLEDIRDHEKAHVETLTAVIEDLGGEPVEEACYEFELDCVCDFLAVAAVLENTGVAAYAGAAPSIENPDLIPPALSIHSVEARHAGYLNMLTGNDSFPTAFDEPKTMDEVLEAVGKYDCDSGDDDDGGENGYNYGEGETLVKNEQHCNGSGGGENEDENEDENEGGGGDNYTYTYNYTYDYTKGDYELHYEYDYVWSENAKQDPNPPAPTVDESLPCSADGAGISPNPDPSPSPP